MTKKLGKIKYKYKGFPITITGWKNDDDEQVYHAEIGDLSLGAWETMKEAKKEVIKQINKIGRNVKKKN